MLRPWSRRRPADPGWVSERSERHQRGRALPAPSSEAAFCRLRREQGSETRNSGPASGSFLRSTGFTVIELMVSLTIMAIAAALALPSYGAMVDKRRLSNATEQLAAFVASGQLEAVRRNTPLTLSYKRVSHKNWCVGMVIGATACDCKEVNPADSDFCAIDGVAQLLDNANFGDEELLHSISGNNSLSFDPVRGILTNADDALTMELHTGSREYRVNLSINPTGDVSVCSKDGSHQLPGYEVCS